MTREVFDCLRTFLGSDKFFVAGGSLISDDYSDIDIWFLDQESLDACADDRVLNESKNAWNTLIGGKKVQIMKTPMDPVELVCNKFDLTILQQFSDAYGNVWYSEKCKQDLSDKKININPKAEWIVKGSILHRIAKYTERTGFEFSESSYKHLYDIITNPDLETLSGYDFYDNSPMLLTLETYPELEHTVTLYALAKSRLVMDNIEICRFFIYYDHKIDMTICYDKEIKKQIRQYRTLS